MNKQTLAERMYDRAVPGPGGCIVYTGGNRGPGGHARIGRHGAGRIMVHRLAWEDRYGPVPDGLLVRHKCDNPPCVNVHHLELGTHADNSRDAVVRGRTVRGERQHLARLTESDVIEIRRDFIRDYRVYHGRRASNAPRLAERYGVSVNTIENVVTGVTWRHVHVEE